MYAIQKHNTNALNCLTLRSSSLPPVAGNWRALDDLLAELWEVGVLEQHLPSLFGVFERHPDGDGAGVLWGIVHGVESLPIDYEVPLQNSLNKQASHMGQVLFYRLEKSRAA